MNTNMFGIVTSLCAGILFISACSGQNKGNEYRVYRTPVAEKKMAEDYREALKLWPVPYRELDVETTFGSTHLIISGPSNGKPLVVLHGSSANSTSWVYNIKGLSQNYKVYAIDVIGDIGKSKMTNKPKNRTDYANWLNEVFEKLGISRASLIGCSYSAAIVHGFISAYPEKTDKAVYISGNYGKTPLRILFRLVGYSIFPSRENIKKMVDWMDGGSLKDVDLENSLIDAYIVRMKECSPYLIDLTNIPDDEVKNLSKPLLILIGEKDGFCSAENVRKYIQSVNPAIRLKIIKGKGHLFFVDDPAIMCREVNRFLKE